VSGGLAAIFFILLANWLPQSEYGSLTTLVVTTTVISSFLNLGVNQTLVNLLSSKNSIDTESSQILSLALVIKLVCGVPLIVFFELFSREIAQILFHKPDLSTYVSIIGYGVCAQLLFAFSVSVAQSRQNYRLWSTLFIVTNLLRLLITGGLFKLGLLTGFISGMCYALIPLLGPIIVFALPEFRFRITIPSKANTHKFLSFNNWTAMFNSVSSVSSRLDSLLTARYVSLSDNGSYGLANQIVSVFPQLITAIGSVTTPKFASFSSPQSHSKYLPKAVLFTSGIAFVSLLFFAIITPHLYSLVGYAYSASQTMFYILLFTQIVFLAASPISDSILHYYRRPKIIFYQSLGQGIVVFSAAIILIQKFGLSGSAISALLGQVFSALFLVISYVWLSKKH